MFFGANNLVTNGFESIRLRVQKKKMRVRRLRQINKRPSCHYPHFTPNFPRFSTKESDMSLLLEKMR